MSFAENSLYFVTFLSITFMAVIFPFCRSISGFLFLYLALKLCPVAVEASEFDGRNLCNTRWLALQAATCCALDMLHCLTL